MDPIRYIVGLDGRIYAVFADSVACEAGEHRFPNHLGYASCGGFENALCVQSLWGQ
jgi:hypothetical protein